MGSSCCCRQKAEKNDSNDNKKSSVTKRSPLHKGSDESPTSDRKLISEDRLNEELKNTIKGGESGYGHQKKKLTKSINKSLSGSQYNTKGLVDERSEEFKMVKNFLDTKGYDVIVSIGSGNYAEVYKAIGKKNRKEVAVKAIDLTKVNENYRTNFLQSEIDVLQICKHPNVIKMYEICQTKNRIFMIMEFAPRGTLTDWLRDKGAFTERMAHIIFSPIVSAINHMHSRRIAHRDLKLENILLTKNMNPKISDFSYAVKCEPNGPKSTNYCGSLPYFSPEILKREPYNPLISDIWSLGVCFFIMLNDGLPFKLGDDSLMLKNQLARNWNFKAKVETKLSKSLKSMIRKMLEPDLKLRITASKLIEDKWITNH